MSKLGNLRKKVGYETDIPRCENCTHYRKRMLYLVDSLPRISQQLCVQHQFFVKANALCDTWSGAKGEIIARGLESGESAPTGDRK